MVNTPPDHRPPPNILQTERFDVENKTFFLDVLENSRGKVVRITEKVGQRKDRIMLPFDAINEIVAAFQRLQQ